MNYIIIDYKGCTITANSDLEELTRKYSDQMKDFNTQNFYIVPDESYKKLIDNNTEAFFKNNIICYSEVILNSLDSSDNDRIIMHLNIGKSQFTLTKITSQNSQYIFESCKSYDYNNNITIDEPDKIYELNESFNGYLNTIGNSKKIPSLPINPHNKKSNKININEVNDFIDQLGEKVIKNLPEKKFEMYISGYWSNNNRLKRKFNQLKEVLPDDMLKGAKIISDGKEFSINARGKNYLTVFVHEGTKKNIHVECMPYLRKSKPILKRVYLHENNPEICFNNQRIKVSLSKANSLHLIAPELKTSVFGDFYLKFNENYIKI